MIDLLYHPHDGDQRTPLIYVAHTRKMDCSKILPLTTAIVAIWEALELIYGERGNVRFWVRFADDPVGPNAICEADGITINLFVPEGWVKKQEVLATRLAHELSHPYGFLVLGLFPKLTNGNYSEEDERRAMLDAETLSKSEAWTNVILPQVGIYLQTGPSRLD